MKTIHQNSPTIPIACKDREATKNITTVTQGITRFLVVDDDPKDLESAATVLRESFANCFIHTATSAEEALDVCGCQEIDCVILDLDLGDSSGFELLLGLNPNPGRPTKAVVILTRLLTPNLHEMILHNGAQACLIKQCTSPRQLSDCIRKAIEVCGLHRPTEVARHPVEQGSTCPPGGAEERGIRVKREMIHKWGRFQAQSLQLLDAAIETSAATRGNVQVFNRELGVLQIVAHRGFKPQFLEFFNVVRIDEDCACSRAFRNGKRVFIPDIRADISFAPYIPIAEEAGFRAVHSTPIIGPPGSVVGVLSTHFADVHSLSQESQLALDDIASKLAQPITDLLEI